MTKYDVYKCEGTHRRVATSARLYSRVWFYNKKHKAWTMSHLRTIDVVLGAHHVLVARNVVFKDSVCSQ
ncbi:hypothetical protein kpv41_08 [Klebsiella phage KpV41]|uniref:Uncharacterized protein n=1 Tax=Klebsiella phage KpV41 TaxID=1747282 RepID=A0A0S2MXM8_9CAUD|nr:hypothetical protein AU164_gp08 [Klebsiella phage KpV41]ALO80699.1 hypothetical protein kpv41_08 [Klebsiella phage KpV41]